MHIYHNQLMINSMKKHIDKHISSYLSQIGKKGGKKSRRVLDPAIAKEMVRIREARKLFKKYYTQCFWSFDPEYKIEKKDISWVANQLMKNGNKQTWLEGRSLCP